MSVPKHHQLPPWQYSHSVSEIPVMNSDENVKPSHWNGNQPRFCTGLSPVAAYFTLCLILRQALALKSSKKYFIFFPFFFFLFFDCSIFLCLREIKSCPWLAPGGELGPRMPKSWRAWGAAGTPDGVLGGYLFFSEEMYNRVANVEYSIGCTTNCSWAWHSGKTGKREVSAVCLVPHSDKTQYLSALSFISSRYQSSGAGLFLLCLSRTWNKVFMRNL